MDEVSIGVPLPHLLRTDRSNILSAALRIADRSGPGSVTIRGVAVEAGVAPMTVYRHVRDRDDLLAGMLGQMFDDAPGPAADDRPWPDRLRSVFVSLRFVGHDHRRTFPLVLEHPRTEGLQRFRTAAFDALADAGVPPGHVVPTDAVVWTLFLGFTVREALGQYRHRPSGGVERAAAAVVAAAEHHVTWVVEDPSGAHPEDPFPEQTPSGDTW